MAIVNKDNSYEGSIGDLIFYKSQGQNLVRFKQTEIKNPRTPAQQQHRMRFATTSKFLKPFRDFVKESFDSYPGSKNGFSGAMSYNMQMGLKGGYPLFEVDYTNALISFGNAVLPEGLVIKKTNNSYELNWDNTLTEGAYDTDMIITVLCDERCHRAFVSNGVHRKEGKCEIELPIGHQSIRCWVIVKANKYNWDHNWSMSWYGGVLNREI